MVFSFNGFLTEEKNLHLEHLEDEVLNSGIVGTRGAINFLQSLRDMLAGNVKSSVNVTVKWDGAPAIFAGINPENNQFFVGTKGVFNKNAKINYSHDDIDRNHPSSGLNQKLKVALTELSKLGIKDVIQGDMMFTQDDLKKETIDGKQYITFQPNTIVYAVPMESAAQILSSSMGIVFHTTYSGKTMEDMSASFNVNLRGLSKNSGVWFSDASYKDTSGTINFNKEETKKITGILSDAGKTFRTLDSGVLSMISEDEETKTLIKTFNNTKVRAGEKIKNTKNRKKCTQCGSTKYACSHVIDQKFHEWTSKFLDGQDLRNTEYDDIDFWLERKADKDEKYQHTIQQLRTSTMGRLSELGMLEWKISKKEENEKEIVLQYGTSYYTISE